ncbi:Glycine dehydrogenase (decarboxylating) [Symbiodinium microadriaticum]|uniref:Glycine dehydrogenase (Decarboxylating) n=1 Tax=Symbiodinium microadriaticum TaxID=2951 RepID=A0A1Q9DN01_SYMMI|nr:Glycine dehydrogenase (decarboxylating) [Symbiodinium microadriaticum]
MVEPTESEDKAELDRFCDAMISIRKEIAKIESGEWPADDNPLKNAPHTQTEEGSRKLEQQLEGVKDWSKYWPTVARVDNSLGDRKLKLRLEVTVGWLDNMFCIELDRGTTKPSAESLAPTPSAGSSASKAASATPPTEGPKGAKHAGGSVESKAATSTPTKADGAQSAKDAGGAESTKDTGGRAHETHETRDHDQRHDEGKEPASGSSNGDKEGGPSSSKPEHSDEKSAATEDAGKGKGTGKGKGKGFPDAFHKGKGKGKAMHRHGRSHSRGRRGQHHHHHNKHHQHHQHHHRHHRHHGHSPPRSLSQRRRLKRLLQRARQLRSHSPRARSAPWSDDEGAVRRLTQAGGSPTRRIASLQRKVGLLQVDGASAPGASSRRHLAAPVKSSALSLDPALAAPMPVASRPARAKVTAFLFNIGEDAEEADKIDQEGDQAEIQEEAKSIVNAESAGYETPTGVEEGEIEEFDHEMEVLCTYVCISLRG